VHGEHSHAPSGRDQRRLWDEHTPRLSVASDVITMPGSSIGGTGPEALNPSPGCRRRFARVANRERLHTDAPTLARARARRGGRVGCDHVFVSDAQRVGDESSLGVARRRRRGQPITLEQRAEAKRRFLEAFAEQKDATKAARVAGVHRSTLYDWRGLDEDFARAWRDVEEAVIDELEANVIAAANHGLVTLEPSNAQARLAEFMLKSRRRGVYGDRQEIDVRRVSVEVRVDTSEERARALAQILADTGPVNV
jgi:hypothetical protein